MCGMRSDHSGSADGCRRGHSVPADSCGRAVGLRRDRRADKAFAAERGVDFGWATTDQVMRLHQYNVFPDMSLLTNADHMTVLTARPGPDPDHGELVMICGRGCLPVRRGSSRPICGDGRRGAPRSGADPGHPVLAGLQRGLHQPGLTHVTLSNEERRVISMHRNLESYWTCRSRIACRG